MNSSMNYIEEFKESINRGPFYYLIKEGLSDNKTVEISYNDNKFDIYKCAVYQAWLDMCRTLTAKNEKKWSEAKNELSKRLQEYFKDKAKGNKEAFDGWYYDMNNNISVIGDFTIGQTQKLINMAFKYL